MPDHGNVMIFFFVRRGPVIFGNFRSFAEFGPSDVGQSSANNGGQVVVAAAERSSWVVVVPHL
jgi:hypothetical protein